MNFTNLKYFSVLAEELNFTRAAKRLYISQQALSSHINKLEQHYQSQLFIRTTPLELTPAGQCLYLFAKETLIYEKMTAKKSTLWIDRRPRSFPLQLPCPGEMFFFRRASCFPENTA